MTLEGLWFQQTISSPYHNQTGSKWVLKLIFNRNIKRQPNKLSRSYTIKESGHFREQILNKWKSFHVFASIHCRMTNQALCLEDKGHLWHIRVMGKWSNRLLTVLSESWYFSSEYNSVVLLRKWKSTSISVWLRVKQVRYTTGWIISYRGTLETLKTYFR